MGSFCWVWFFLVWEEWDADRRTFGVFCWVFLFLFWEGWAAVRRIFGVCFLGLVVLLGKMNC